MTPEDLFILLYGLAIAINFNLVIYARGKL
jgi:hypothetical protein